MVATIAVTITTIIRTDTGTGATTDIRAIGIIGTTMIDLFSLVLGVRQGKTFYRSSSEKMMGY
jgi:hypothetical protein